jgi:N-acetylmuramoyl-L-alanine amidase
LSQGGSDPGAVANNTKEKDLNLSIALACRDMLVKHGVSVQMSRTKDENDPIGDEVKECNAYAPDLAVDIHNNAGGGDGGEVFYSHLGGKGKTLAENILAEIVKVGQNSRGIKTRVNSQGKDYYAFIRNTSCPATIVECAFVDNASDLKILATESQRQTMGEAIAKGILKTLGVEFQSEKGYWKVQVGAYLYKENAVAMQKKIKAVGFDAFIVKE